MDVIPQRSDMEQMEAYVHDVTWRKSASLEQKLTYTYEISLKRNIIGS